MAGKFWVHIDEIPYLCAYSSRSFGKTAGSAEKKIKKNTRWNRMFDFEGGFSQSVRRD
jgi:hypothetical protein